MSTDDFIILLHTSDFARNIRVKRHIGTEKKRQEDRKQVQEQFCNYIYIRIIIVVKGVTYCNTETDAVLGSTINNSRFVVCVCTTRLFVVYSDRVTQNLL